MCLPTLISFHHSQYKKVHTTYYNTSQNWHYKRPLLYKIAGCHSLGTRANSEGRGHDHQNNTTLIFQYCLSSSMAKRTTKRHTNNNEQAFEHITKLSPNQVHISKSTTQKPARKRNSVTGQVLTCISRTAIERTPLLFFALMTGLDPCLLV